MQIFQPCESFEECAGYLSRDPKRLGKQVIELCQIYVAVWSKINGKKHGYANHPMVLHIYNNGKPYNLFPYIRALNREWFRLGYKRSGEFLLKLAQLEAELTPCFTEEPYRPFYCKKPDFSYENVCEKYRALLNEKWGACNDAHTP
jgi:hypothetical protein